MASTGRGCLTASKHKASRVSPFVKPTSQRLIQIYVDKNVIILCNSTFFFSFRWQKTIKTTLAIWQPRSSKIIQNHPRSSKSLKSGPLWLENSLQSNHLPCCHDRLVPLHHPHLRIAWGTRRWVASGIDRTWWREKSWDITGATNLDIRNTRGCTKPSTFRGHSD